MSNPIFNSNDYQRGYDDGYNTGFAGKDKNYFRSGLSLKFVIHGNDALNTYNNGYDKGFEMGCYDRLSKEKPQAIKLETPNVNYNNFQTTNNLINMGTIQQYSLQREKLIELTQFLTMFNEEINQKLMEYRQRVQIMYETGLPQETRNRFEMEHIMETEQLVNTISQLINERSIPFTMQNIELMENLIALNS